jgi:hypothetical protein
MDISNPNFVSMDASYALENNRIVLFSHESTDTLPSDPNENDSQEEI